MRPRLHIRASRQGWIHRIGLLCALVIMTALVVSPMTWRTSAVTIGGASGRADVVKNVDQGAQGGAGGSSGVQAGPGSGAGGCTMLFAQATGSPIPVSGEPESVAVGDFNSDGKQDLAVADFDSDEATILLGNGMGGFTEATGSPVSVGTAPVFVAVGDFNSDGKQDLATANLSSDDVTILIGNGTGGFTEATGSPVAAGDGPYSIAVGDFNRDGKQDLAAANLGSDNVTILLGDAMGGFTQPTGSPIAAGNEPRSVVVGDFNRDGKQDLAVASSVSSDVTILLGNGMGGFTEATGSPVTVDAVPLSVAVGDFNSDGKQDLATANSGSNDVTILLGNGMGGFTEATGSPVATGENPRLVAVGDFNNDGKQDLTVTGSFDVTILLNTCDATPCVGTIFTEAAGSPFAAVADPYSVAVGDFNRDGKQDLVTANYGSNNAMIHLGDGTGSFPDAMASTVGAGIQPIAVAVGDFNNDGQQDFAVANFYSGNVTIRLGDGTGGFPDATASTVGAGARPRSVAIGDFNRDGNQDLAVANAASANVTIRLGDGTGGFPDATASTVGAGMNPYSVAIGDFNRDGKQDLAATSQFSDSVTIRLGDGTGGFPDAMASTVAAGDGPYAVAVGDFNRDGKQDLAVANYTSQNVTIRLGDGMGGFPDANASTVAAGDGAGFVAIGDFNLDGKQDLAVVNSNAANVTIRLGDGAGGFPTAMTVGADEGAISLAIGDFNHDGKQDMAVANYAADNVTIQLNSCNQQADLSVTKTDMADPVMLGQQIKYHILVKNNGPDDATGVVVTDTMPSSSTFISATPSAGSCTRVGGIVTCNIGNLSNGASAFVNVVVRSSGNPGTITDVVSVRANETDPNTSNNHDSESTRTVGFRSFKFSPPIVTGGCQDSTGTLLFTSPAPAGVTIKFPDNLAAIAPIPQVVTQGGELSIQVTAMTSIVNAEQLGTVTATTTAGPNSIAARLKLLPVKISSLNFSENPVEGGEHITGTVTLTCAPTRNVVVRLSSNKAAARPDVSTVTIHAGQTSAQFGITTLAVPSARDVIFTATLNGLIQRATLHLIP